MQSIGPDWRAKTWPSVVGDVNVRMLGERLCLCVMMYRINPPHLLWTLDILAARREVNRIVVEREVKDSARLAPQRRLDQSHQSALQPI